ncbi:MAG: hypothetical protein R3B47_18235 [Bacteroidia bacterium]
MTTPASAKAGKGIRSCHIGAAERRVHKPDYPASQPPANYQNSKSGQKLGRRSDEPVLSVGKVFLDIDVHSDVLFQAPSLRFNVLFAKEC